MLNYRNFVSSICTPNEYIPYARHYKPRLVYFLPTFRSAFMYCDLWPYDLSFWTETWLSHCGQTRIGRTWGPFIHYVKGYLAKNLLSYYIYCAFNAATMESATAAGAGSKIRDIIAWLELSRCHTTFSSQKLTVTHTKMNHEIFDSNWPYVRIACHSISL